MTYNYTKIAMLALAAMLPGAANASGIVFQGQNPAVFANANAGNSAALIASTNRPKDRSLSNSTAGQLSPASIVEQSVLGQISSNIYTQIFNTSNAAGNFDLGGGNLISYVRAGGNLIINVTDPVHGQTTITLPSL